MTQDKKFREDYATAALELVKFLSFESFDKYHVTETMPEVHPRLLNTAGELRFTFQGAAGNECAKDFDNMVRHGAAQSFGFMRMHIGFLRDIARGKSPVADPGWIPAIDITDMPDGEEIARREQAAAEKHKQDIAGHQENYAYYQRIVDSHPPGANGRTALYKDVKYLIREERTREKDIIHTAFLGWLSGYAEQKIKGRADKDILPLPITLPHPLQP
jgi:hypothetical protein